MLVTPDKDIQIGERKFTLVGSFKVLKELQHAFQRDIIPIQASVMHMRQDQIAKFIAIANAASSHSLTAPTDEEIGQLILDEMDIADNDYIVLKAEIMTWLLLAMTPKRDREKKRPELNEIVRKIRANLTSPGMTTSESQPASSDGPSTTSSEATSGPSSPQ